MLHVVEGMVVVGAELLLNFRTVDQAKFLRRVGRGRFIILVVFPILRVVQVNTFMLVD